MTIADTRAAQFRRGQKVEYLLHGAGVTSKEIRKIKSVGKKGIWLDCGEGNSPEGPFNKNGRMGGSFGFWAEIRPVDQTGKST